MTGMDCNSLMSFLVNIIIPVISQMNYIFKEKLNLHDLADLAGSKKLAVIAEPEEYLAGLYRKILLQHDYEVALCHKLELLLGALENLQPHVLIVNPELGQPVELLKNVTTHFPNLPIITLGYDIPAEQVKEFMALGIVSHINRKMTKPQDIVSVIQTILGNN